MVFYFEAIAGKAAKIRIFKLGLKQRYTGMCVNYFKTKNLTGINVSGFVFKNIYEDGQIRV